jgi:predicted RND superfamily exporter protein
MLEKFLIWTSKAFRKPWPVIALAVIVTAIFAVGIPKLKFDSNIKSMLPSTNRALVVNDYYEDESRFGASDMIYVGVDTPDAFSSDSLHYIQDVQNAIESINMTLPAKNMAKLLHVSVADAQTVIDALKGVGINEGNYAETLIPLITSAEQLEQNFGWEKPFAEKIAKAASSVSKPKLLYDYYENPIDKTQSLVNADYIACENDELIVQKLVLDGDLSPENVAALKGRVDSWEIYKDALVSSDGKLATVLVSLNTSDLDVKASLNKEIQSILTDKAKDGYATYLDGEPVIESMISQQMFSDIMLLLPVVVIMVLLILFLCFKSIQGVTYPAAIIIFSVITTMGLMGFCNIPISIVGITIPVLLVAIVSAYGIHQMNHYLLDTDTNKLSILNRNMQNVGLAITLSGITVMVGFGALIAEDFVPIKNFGIFTAIGDFVGVIGALYVLPALILTSKKPKTVFNKESQKGFVSVLLRFFNKCNRRHSGLILIAASVISVVAILGTLGLKAELNNVSFFKKSNPIHVADDHLNEKLAGTEVLNVILDSDLTDPAKRASDYAPAENIEITNPEVLKKVEQFSVDVKKEFPFATKVISFNQPLKKMNQVMNGGGDEYYCVPDSANLISQYLMIFTGDVSGVLSPNHDKLRISINMKRVPTAEVVRVREYCQNYFSKDFRDKNHLQVQISGTANLYEVANTLLVNGMIFSIILCVIIVFVLLILVLQSFLMSLIALLPIFMTLLINFGVMGMLGIPLNVATAIVSSIAIGIGVDYSIHFITWYRNELRATPDIHVALENTIDRKGRGILYNMFVVFGGFFVLVISNFVPLIQFGGLVAFCMLLSAFGALAIVPAVIRLLAKKDFNFLYLGTRGKKA